LKLVINNLKIPIEQDRPQVYLAAAAKKMGIGSIDALSIITLLSKSPDFRDQDQFYYKISMVVSIDDSFANKQEFQIFTQPVQKSKKAQQREERPIIVGFGPAGMFAALELIDNNFAPIIFERGKKIEERGLDIEHFIKKMRLNPESNIQFGEGGAGSYSDGKLFSRRNKNSSVVNQVLKTFVRFGAPADIEYISKPHLGTDVLCEIVKNIRRHITQHGGEIHYNSKMTDILITKGTAMGIVVNGEEEYLSPAIFIGLGHSARDTFTMLKGKGVTLEPRKISVGVRIEHPAEIINQMRYGDKYYNFPSLGAATYSINHTNRKIRRGVYTFCMCPGGEIVNASSEADMLVLNGMSYSDRSLPYSNGGLVVSCHTSDYPSSDPLAGLAFQRTIEQKAFQAGGSDWSAPGQSLLHFLGEKTCNSLHENSYQMGVTESDMHEIFPEFITRELHLAFQKWKAEVPLFVSHHALLVGPETRTSSPVRITRSDTFESVNTKNLYAIGEGSGYTGGITSSAADAIRAVGKFIQR